jgi:hypothetical protein
VCSGHGFKEGFFLFFLEVIQRTLEQIEDTFEPIHAADLIQECVKRIFSPAQRQSVLKPLLPCQHLLMKHSENHLILLSFYVS